MTEYTLPTQYQLIRQTNVTDFGIAVNNFLKDGWELYGDTEIRTEKDMSGEITVFYQVMVK